MTILLRKVFVFFCLVSGTLVFIPGVLQAETVPDQLNILLTNDDGYSAAGIQALQVALEAAGHNVTIVAPLENESGSGGSTRAFGMIDIIEQAPGIWSVDGTPFDSVLAGLQVIFGGNPPDLIISGMNFGQNLGQIASNTSGTMGAALIALYKGIPSIAVSVGIIISEINDTPDPFPSTLSAFPPAANFMVQLIEQLQRSSTTDRILPERTMLNINIPVPYGDIQGIKITNMGQLTFATPQFLDIDGVIPNGGGAVMATFEIYEGEDPVNKADTDAFGDGYISISILNGDMTAANSVAGPLKHRLYGIGY